ncbi:Lysine methyltransferase [Quillaja saponaria]|uniref:Lysine methyltransferase n=1 Tax=Quillaja saponaria TaxID=32244 RepID=A0AAD7L7F5_QUISA|nr:Lysine methyltransferase [Quillaja saponaria]
MAAQDDNDEDINPITMILPDGHNDVGANSLSSIIQEGKQEQQKHFLPSINSTVVIRQLPSEGIGFQLWPAATTLVSLLDQYRCDVAGSTPLSPALSALSNGSNSRPLCILELGSGTGMVGIAAAITLGANVTVTDLPHVVPNLQFNADANASILAENGGTVYVAPLRWGHAEDVELIGREFDFILASDVVYHDHLFDPLLQTLRLLLSDGVGVRVAERKTGVCDGPFEKMEKGVGVFQEGEEAF